MVPETNTRRLTVTNHLWNSVQSFPGGSDGNEFACKAGDPGSVPGSGRSPGEGNG